MARIPKSLFEFITGAETLNVSGRTFSFVSHNNQQ